MNEENNKENSSSDQGNNGKFGGFVILFIIFGAVFWFAFDWIIGLALVGAELKSGGDTDYSDAYEFFNSQTGKIVFVTVASAVLAGSLISNASATKQDLERGWQKFKCPQCRSAWKKQNVLNTGNTGYRWRYETATGQRDKRRKHNVQITNFVRNCECSKCGAAYSVVYEAAEKHTIKNKIAKIELTEG